MKALFIYILVLSGFCCMAQSITSAEYFFNTDPGVGNGTVLTVNANSGQLIQSYSISTSSLGEGFHSLYIRTKNDVGNWSLYHRQVIYVKTFTTSNIAAAEYFFNTDPGVGNGTVLAVNANSGQLTQSYAISTSGLSEGFHSLYIRTKNDVGNWSLYHRQVIYIKTFTTSNIAAAEYFFNTDPDAGSGTVLAVNANSGQLTQSYSISTSSLGEGFHSFYIRTKDANGNWSLFHRQVFYIKDFDLIPDDVTTAEYFIDTDPGVGNGTAIVFGDASQATQILNIDATSIAEGDHIFYVRVKTLNGAWSIYDSAAFSLNALGLEDSLFKTTTVYPNPFINIVNIESSNNLVIEKVAIYDIHGKTVYSNNNNSKKIDLEFLAQGIYILKLKANDSEATFKIVKQ